MLIFCDSFDHYQTADIARKWTGTAFTSIQTTAGRRGTQCLRCNSGSATASINVPAAATYIVGGAILKPSLTQNSTMLTFLEGATVHCIVRVEVGGHFAAYRGSTSTEIGLGTIKRVPQNGYVYMECRVFISDTVGTVEVRINGEVVLNLTNLDNRNGATGIIDSVRIAGNLDWDDFYICDTTGANNNTFLGDVEIEHVVPDGAGNATQWTNLTGAATHWQAVNESPAVDDLTSFVDTATNTHLDQFTFGNLSTITGGSTILAVQANCMAKVDSGAATIRQVKRPTTVDFNGANFVLGTAWANIREIWETDLQAVAAWTDTTFNATEFGFEKVA